MVISSLDSLIERVLAEDARKQDLLDGNRHASGVREEILLPGVFCQDSLDERVK